MARIDYLSMFRGELPVGYVTYFPEEDMKVDRLFAEGPASV